MELAHFGLVILFSFYSFICFVIVSVPTAGRSAFFIWQIIIFGWPSCSLPKGSMFRSWNEPNMLVFSFVLVDYKKL